MTAWPVNPVAFVFWTFMLGVPAFTVGSLLLSRHRQRRWPRAAARVEGSAGGGLRVGFEGPAGPVAAPLRGLRPDHRHAPRIGETVLVAYDPADPRHVVLAAEGPWHLGLLVVWSVVLAGLVAGFLAWSGAFR